MVKLDYSLFIQIVNFIAMIFILNYFLYKPILNIIERRKKNLQDMGDEVSSLDQAVEQKMADYEQKLREARIEAMNQRTEVQMEAAAVGKGIIDEARVEISQIVEVFKEKTEIEMEAARKILRKQAEKISVEISEKVLGRSIS